MTIRRMTEQEFMSALGELGGAVAAADAFEALARLMSFAWVWLAYDVGARDMQRASARLVREYPDRRKADSTVWRIDSVLADELAARIECIYPEDL